MVRLGLSLLRDRDRSALGIAQPHKPSRGRPRTTSAAHREARRGGRALPSVDHRPADVATGCGEHRHTQRGAANDQDHRASLHHCHCGSAHRALPTYTVRRGDTLWGIAERYLGDPLRWKEITALNTDRREGTSEFTDPHWIYPGWTLVLPADARGLAESPTVSPQQATPPSSVTRQGAATHGAAQTPVQPKRSVTPVSPAGNGTTRSHPPQGVTLPRQPAPRSSPSVQNQQSNDRHSGKDLPQHPNRAPIAPVGFGILAVGLLGLLAAGCAAPRNDTAGRGVASSFRRELQQTSSVPSSPMSIDRWQPLSTALVDCSVRFCTAPTARR